MCLKWGDPVFKSEQRIRQIFFEKEAPSYTSGCENFPSTYLFFLPRKWIVDMYILDAHLEVLKVEWVQTF